MSLRGSSRRKVISISGAPEAFLISGAKFFFLGAGAVATTPFFLAFVGRRWKEIGVNETEATSFHYSSSFLYCHWSCPISFLKFPVLRFI